MFKLWRETGNWREPSFSCIEIWVGVPVRNFSHQDDDDDDDKDIWQGPGKKHANAKKYAKGKIARFHSDRHPDFNYITIITEQPPPVRATMHKP